MARVFGAYVAGEEHESLQTMMAHTRCAPFGGPLNRRRCEHMRLAALFREGGEVVEHPLRRLQREAERATGPQVVGDELLQHDGTSTSQRCAIAPTSAVGIGGTLVGRVFGSLVIHGCATCPSKHWSTRA